mmetsp:Transcript_28925/g.92448  ORF Transcript_28925/g.92448 Transcript_28925/m.92448 type:complete len:209 (-) Transcript_28925:250-876(-)
MGQPGVPRHHGGPEGVRRDAAGGGWEGLLPPARGLEQHRRSPGAVLRQRYWGRSPAGVPRGLVRTGALRRLQILRGRMSLYDGAGRPRKELRGPRPSRVPRKPGPLRRRLRLARALRGDGGGRGRSALRRHADAADRRRRGQPPREAVRGLGALRRYLIHARRRGRPELGPVELDTLLPPRRRGGGRWHRRLHQQAPPILRLHLLGGG